MTSEYLEFGYLEETGEALKNAIKYNQNVSK